jgi:hypothetical protein
MRGFCNVSWLTQQCHREGFYIAAKLLVLQKLTDSFSILQQQLGSAVMSDKMGSVLGVMRACGCLKITMAKRGCCSKAPIGLLQHTEALCSSKKGNKHKLQKLLRIAT